MNRSYMLLYIVIFTMKPDSILETLTISWNSYLMTTTQIEIFELPIGMC